MSSKRKKMSDLKLWGKVVDIDFAQEYIILYSIYMHLENAQEDGVPYIYTEHILRHARNLQKCLIQMLPYQEWFEKNVPNLFPLDMNQWNNNYAQNKTEFWQQAAIIECNYKQILLKSMQANLLDEKEHDFSDLLETILQQAGELYQLLLEMHTYKDWFSQNTPIISCLFVYAAEVQTNILKRTSDCDTPIDSV